MQTVQSSRQDFDVKTESEGKWEYIFADLLPNLKPAMEKAGFHVACPVHGGTDGFRLFKDFHRTGGGYCNTCGPQSNGFALLAWAKSYAFRDAVREVAGWIRGDDALPVPIMRSSVPVSKPEDFALAQDHIQRVLAASLPVKGTAAETYLVSRGIAPNDIPATLRFHAGLKYLHGKEMENLGTFPCLLAPVTGPTGRILSVHRTYLTRQGEKAPVPDAKKLMGKGGYLGGSAVKLFPAQLVLGLAEGLETALAVRTVTHMPIWSCISAKLLELVQIPESVEKVVIWADSDVSETGQKSAAILADRLIALGKVVEIALPSLAIPRGEKGVDWLDVVEKQGSDGFPENWRNFRMQP